MDLSIRIHRNLRGSRDGVEGCALDGRVVVFGNYQYCHLDHLRFCLELGHQGDDVRYLDARAAFRGFADLQGLDAGSNVDAEVFGLEDVELFLLGLYDVGQGDVARLVQAQIGRDDGRQAHQNGLQATVNFARDLELSVRGFELAGKGGLRQIGQRGEHLAGLVAVVVDRLFAQDDQTWLFLVDQGLEQLGNGQRLQFSFGFHQDGAWFELASAGQFDGQGDHHSPRPYVRQAFRKYLECGIFAHGFARAWCDDCGHDYFVAYSCKGRGVCPSCNTRRMVETAAHLCDHVFPRLPVRQWVLSVPKRLRYFMQRDGAVLNMVLRIFLRVIAQSLQTHSPGAANVDKATLHIGAVAFIHRFGSSLNAHVHFHVCVVDGVFEEIPVAVVGQTDVQSSPPGIVFHPASAIDETAVAQVQTDLRRRILRAFVGRGLIEKADAKEMLAYQHSGFSVDAGVCIEADDRAALERLLRYCARPPFAMERLRKEGAALVYRCAKQRSEPTSDKRGAKVDELHLTALELIDRIAALVPPPRTHRHRYFGVLAPNSPLRSAVTAMADAQPDATGDDAHRPAPLGNAISPTPEPVPTKRPAHYLWAVLIARIYEVFPLLCPLCGGQMRLIAFVTEGRQIRRILDHIGMDSEPPHIAPARGPPLWDDCGDAQMDDGAQTEPDWATDWDGAAQPVPDFEVDQRINW